MLDSEWEAEQSMAISTVDHGVDDLCGGEQWFVDDLDGLAKLVAIVMVGRAQLVTGILAGAEIGPVPTSAALKVRLNKALFPEKDPWHRDGLLFETICWLVARKGAAANEVVSDPHRRATNQGADSVKVIFDETARELRKVTVYEQKCTDDPRTKFRDEVLPAFSDWITGTRDDELLQIAIGLLARFNLTEAESNRAYGRIALAPRPIAFRAALTVSPEAFPQNECKKVFKDYDDLAVDLEARFGDTFPLKDMRGWFKDFAALVWAKIEAFDV
ncbi:hypothetical protein [Ancylobacter vacuolatus]|uniref:Restriction endonuclease n=1 Tax=Ancylobacter vacuolatus TaxID=223389 RepID=A0ABU0DEI3_9HYPH|nr:hypothetical protein [Ancylobacter vacuolatus]MDQ0346753.1 hypothetical protein [Ancylobacter vacuolatus]